jgi:SRSO17 transposase
VSRGYGPTHDVTDDQISRALADLVDSIGHHFVRLESRRRAGEYLLGLLSNVPRKNGWRIAEHARHRSPDSIQWLLNGAAWDAERLRADAVRYVADHLGEPAGSLVLDDVGFAKRGHTPVGVDRQYNRVTERFENCQVAVFLAYASSRGRALVDRGLYLPSAWCGDLKRRQAAGVPASVTHRTRAEIARALLERTLRSTLPVRLVTAGIGYATEELREFCASAGLAYAFEVWAEHAVRMPSGSSSVAGEVNRQLPERAFELRLPATGGAPVECHWALVPLIDGDRLLIRRGAKRTDDARFYWCHADRDVGLDAWIRTVQRQSTVVECVEEARRYAGLDYEVRKYVSWYRHVTMAMLAYSFLAVNRSGWARPPVETTMSHIMGTR